MQLNFNNQQMAHMLSEIVVFIGITFYFSTRIKNIEKKITLQNNRINDLEETITNQKKIIKLILSKLQDDLEKREENIPEPDLMKWETDVLPILGKGRHKVHIIVTHGKTLKKYLIDFKNVRNLNDKCVLNEDQLNEKVVPDSDLLDGNSVSVLPYTSEKYSSLENIKEHLSNLTKTTRTVVRTLFN